VLRGTKLVESREFIPSYKFSYEQWRGPGLSPVTNLSWEQERFAKTVTSLFTLLSVLGVRVLFCHRKPYHLQFTVVYAVTTKDAF
jgi:hypothetical protein